MNLKIVNIGNKGKEDEYILFYAEGGCQLHNYLIHDDTFDKEGELSNILRHMYRFPRKSLKKGEYAALYTKKKGLPEQGTYNKIPCYIMYWGTNSDIFNDAGDNIYLLLINETQKVVIK